MSQAVQVTCPNCQNVLRVPPNLGDASVKCKHCGYILQLKMKAAAPPAPPPSRPVPPVFASPIVHPPAKAPPPPPPPGTGRPAPAPALPLEPLPEYAPPMPVGYGQPPAYAPPQYPPPPYAQPPYAQPQYAQPQYAQPQYAPPQYAQPQPGYAPAPAYEQSAPVTGEYNPAFETGQRYAGRGSYKGPRGSGIGKWVVLGVIFVIGGAALAIVLFKRDWFENSDNKPGQDQVKANTPNNDGNNPGANSNTTVRIDPVKKPIAMVPTGPMPRRILGISVNEYLYLNPVRAGINPGALKESERKDFFKAIERLATGWKIPKDQMYVVTDGPVENNKVDAKHLPIKMVIEGAIDQFLTSSRAQDRIVIVFAGHAMEKDGEAFLVPLEGEFEEIGSLIPLKPIYEKLAKCSAQEKLVLFDVCRYDPGRGVDRPMFGVMTPELEKALHDSPEGTSVMTSCSAGQHSYEYEYWQVSVPGLARMEHYGSVFMSLFFAADTKKGALSKLTPPEAPLPFGHLREYLDEFVPKSVKDLEKKDQVPKFTAKPRKEWLAYNKEAPLAPRIQIPQPPPTAKPAEVAAMFNELALPPVKASILVDEKEIKLSEAFFFTEEQLKGYFDDGPTFEELQKAPEKFEKEFPLRAAVVETVLEMRLLKQAAMLPLSYAPPITDAKKTEITNRYQRLIAEREEILRTQKEKLEDVGKNRDKEKSKRWLAHYDYAYAQVRLRLAYLSEYNLALGKVKLEQLPEIDPAKHKGWKIAATEKMVSSKDVRDMAQDAKSALDEMVKQNPGTPWAIVARSQRGLTLGQTWVIDFKEGESPDGK